MLQINTAATPDKHDFLVAQQRLTGGSRGQTFTGNQAYSNRGAQPANTGNGVTSTTSGHTGNGANQPSGPTGRVELPSTNLKSYQEGIFAVRIPDNWQEIKDQSGLWFAPNGAFGSANGQSVFTHGVSFGAVQSQGRKAQELTDEFVKSLTQGSNMRARGASVPVNLPERSWQLIRFDNVNEATGRPELVNILTTSMQNGDLLYMITVCPTDEYQKYQQAFSDILRSVQLGN